MQEKSSYQPEKQWSSTLDFIVHHIWKHDDLVIGAGVGAAIGALIMLTLHICAMY